MDEWLGRLLTITYPVLIVCGSGLLGYWMKLRHARRVELHKQEVEELSAQLDALRADMDVALADVTERLDFAERLLARNPARPPVESRIPTPV